MYKIQSSSSKFFSVFVTNSELIAFSGIYPSQLPKVLLLKYGVIGIKIFVAMKIREEEKQKSVQLHIKSTNSKIIKPIKWVLSDVMRVIFRSQFHPVLRCTTTSRGSLSITLTGAQILNLSNCSSVSCAAPNTKVDLQTTDLTANSVGCQLCKNVVQDISLSNIHGEEWNLFRVFQTLGVQQCNY